MSTTSIPMSYPSSEFQAFETGKSSQNLAYYELAEQYLLATRLTQELPSRSSIHL